MDGQIFTIVIVAVVAAAGVFAIKAYAGIVKEKTKAARAVEAEKSSPQSALKEFLELVNNAPQLYMNQKALLDAEMKKNPQGDHAELRFQVDMLAKLTRYQTPIKFVAPIIGPALIKRARGIVGGA